MEKQYPPTDYGPDFDEQAYSIVAYIHDVLKSDKGFYAHAGGWYFTDGQTCQVCGEPKRVRGKGVAKPPKGVQIKACSSFERDDLEAITENYAQQILAFSKTRRKLKKARKRIKRLLGELQTADLQLACYAEKQKAIQE